ncbi:restriction endonuclease subunit S [Geobacillus stearothermophilus]|uniref:restriction endonuclease subunit S n=1 Tax=Geobacillus stearothermophilus TaxID=1422 RepID=UPI0009BBFEF8
MEYVQKKSSTTFGEEPLNKKNWKKQKLNDVCLRKGEYGSGSSAIPYDSGKPRYIRITDIRDDGSLNDDIVAPSNPDDYEKYRLNEGDILFARSGATVGKTYLHSEKNGSSPQHVLDKQYSFLHKDLKKSRIC